MPIQSSPVPISELALARVGRMPGVYALWDGDAVVYYGVAEEDLRASLRHHYEDGFPPATHFQAEPEISYMTLRERQAELLLDHTHATGSYPFYNLPEYLVALMSPEGDTPLLANPSWRGNPANGRAQPGVYVVPRL